MKSYCRSTSAAGTDDDDAQSQLCGTASGRPSQGNTVPFSSCTHFISFIVLVGMRRPREDSPSNTAVPPYSGNDPSTARPPVKRPKTSQACTSCRKHKTRCELLDSASRSRCHRCDVLSITCSFETNAPPTQAADFSPTPVAIFRQRILNAILSTPQSNLDKCLEQAPSDARCPSPRSTATSPWEFLKVPGIPDWSATPMLAMLTLSKMARAEQPMTQPVSNLTFTEVLTSDQRHYLLRLCVVIAQFLLSTLTLYQLRVSLCPLAITTTQCS